MKRVKYLCLSLLLSTHAFSAVVKMQGTGEGIVGSNQSQEEVEAYAFLMAQVDAGNKIGSYVESNITVSKMESNGSSSEMTKETVRGFTGGLLRLVEGTKSVKKEFRDSSQIILTVRVTAQFEIDADVYEKSLESYAKESRNRTNIDKKIDALMIAEREVTELDASDLSKVGFVLASYNGARSKLAEEIIRLNGGAIVENISQKRDSKEERIKSYIDNVNKLAIPNVMWKAKILGTNISESQGYKVKAEIKVGIETNKEIAKVLKENYKANKSDLKNCGISSSHGKIPPIRQFPLALEFLDKDGEVLILFAFRTRGEYRYQILGGYLAVCDLGNMAVSFSEEKMDFLMAGLNLGWGSSTEFGAMDGDINSSHSFRSLGGTITLTANVPESIMKRTTSVKVEFLPEVSFRNPYQEENLFDLAGFKSDEGSWGEPFRQNGVEFYATPFVKEAKDR